MHATNLEPTPEMAKHGGTAEPMSTPSASLATNSLPHGRLPALRGGNEARTSRCCPGIDSTDDKTSITKHAFEVRVVSESS